MKKDKHPTYQKVLFVDSSTGHRFVCGSSYQTAEREVYEGVEYPVCRLSISSRSHPFFVGSNQFVDAEGRIDKFLKRYQAKPAPVKEEKQEKAAPKKKKAK